MRVRVTTLDGERLVGDILATRGALLLSMEGKVRRSVPLDSVRTLQISRGHDRTAGAQVGGAAAGLIGALLGMSAGAEEDPGGYGGLLGGLGGLLTGALIGGVGGAAIAPERWSDGTQALSLARQPSAAAPAASRSETATYTLAFASDTRLRVMTLDRPGERWVGRVIGQSSDTLMFLRERSSQRQAVLIDRLERLEVRGGRNRKKGMLIGAVAGTVLGATVGRVEGNGLNDAIGQGIVGTLFGYVFAPTGWKRVPLPQP